MEKTGRQKRRRQKKRRRLLTDKEFKKLIERGTTIKYDRRGWTERRKSARRKK